MPLIELLPDQTFVLNFNAFREGSKLLDHSTQLDVVDPDIKDRRPRLKFC